MWHDLGYSKYDYFDAITDRTLIANIAAVLNDQYDDTTHPKELGPPNASVGYVNKGVTPEGYLIALRVKSALELGFVLLPSWVRPKR